MAQDNSPRSNGTNIPQASLLRANSLQNRLNSANVFFGPGDSLAPVAPANSPVRAFDYAFGVNLNTQPRSFARVPFHILRRFAREYPLLAMVIGHMKDRISSKSWVVRTIKGKDETAADHQKRNAADPRVKELTDLFSCPDGENSWRQWVRKYLDDYMTIDAACIAPERKLNKRIYRLIVVDGASIVRKIDQQGMTAGYQQMVKGLPYKDLLPEDLLYSAENIMTDHIYGYSRVEQTLAYCGLGVARLTLQTQTYEDGDQPAMFAFLPEDTQPADVEAWDALYRKWMLDRANRRRIYWMADPGRDPVPIKVEDPTDKMDELLNRFICFCFGTSPSALVPQVNRAASAQMADDADEAGETPMSDWLVGEMNKIVQRPAYFGYDDMEFALEEPTEVDEAAQAIIDSQVFLIANAVGAGEQYYNEMRERKGQPPAIIIKPEPVEPDDDGSDSGGDGDPGGDNPAGGGSSGGGGNRPPKGKQGKAVAPGKTQAAKATLTIDPAIETKAKTKAAAAISDALKGIFTDQAKLLANEVTARYTRLRRTKANVTLTDDEINDIAKSIMETIGIDWSDIIPSVSKAITSAATDGVAVAGVQLGLDDHDIFSQANEWAISYAEERGAELVGMKLVNGEYVDNPNAEWAITQTTRNHLQEIVVDALKSGDAPATLKKTIMGATDFSDSRADMVGTTETNFANANGQMELGRLVGHTHKRSIVSGDHDVDDECDENEAASEGDGIAIDDTFPDGSMCSPFHPRCVCLTQTFEPGKEL